VLTAGVIVAAVLIIRRENRQDQESASESCYWLVTGTIDKYGLVLQAATPLDPVASEIVLEDALDDVGRGSVEAGGLMRVYEEIPAYWSDVELGSVTVDERVVARVSDLCDEAYVVG